MPPSLAELAAISERLDAESGSALGAAIVVGLGSAYYCCCSGPSAAEAKRAKKKAKRRSEKRREKKAAAAARRAQPEPEPEPELEPEPGLHDSWDAAARQTSSRDSPFRTKSVGSGLGDLIYSSDEPEPTSADLGPALPKRGSPLRAFGGVSTAPGLPTVASTDTLPSSDGGASSDGGSPLVPASAPAAGSPLFHIATSPAKGATDVGGEIGGNARFQRLRAECVARLSPTHSHPSQNTKLCRRCAQV